MAQVAGPMIRQYARISGIELGPALRAVCQVRFHFFSQDGIHDFRFRAASRLDAAPRPDVAPRVDADDAPIIHCARQEGVVGPKMALALLACQTVMVGHFGYQQSAGADDQSGSQQQGSNSAKTNSFPFCAVFYHIQPSHQTL
jgi:hypothetical protein